MDALAEIGGGSLEVTARKQGAEILLQFSDTGPGIRDPERVFDPFYTTKPVGKGTGLGLSAVYGMIQDHGGQITCQNKPEGGALFVIRLPATMEPAAQVAGAAGYVAGVERSFLFSFRRFSPYLSEPRLLYHKFAMSSALLHSSARVLEFETLRELLRGYTSSPLGHARRRHSRRRSTPSGSRASNSSTSEIRDFRRVGGRFEFSGLVDVH